MATVLLIEDNPHIMKINTAALHLRDYEVLCAGTIEEGRRLLGTNPVDVIVLDIMLPDGSGLDWCSELRQQYSTPIIFLSALSTDNDIILGLQMGGDDYISKPYSLDVLVARIEARLRTNASTPRYIHYGALKLDTLSMTGHINGEDMLLTQKEFAVLQLLVKNEGHVVDKESIIAQVWRHSMKEDNNALYTVMSRIKKKLRPDDTGIVISLQRPVGYMIEQY